MEIGIKYFVNESLGVIITCANPTHSLLQPMSSSHKLNPLQSIYPVGKHFTFAKCHALV